MINATAIIRKNVLSRYQPGVWIAVLVSFLNSASFSIGLPFLALYLSQKRGLSASLIGVIMLVGIAFPSLPQLLGGSFADRLGRRPLLIITAVVAVFSFIALAVAIGNSAPLWLIAVLYTLTRSAIVTQRPALWAIVIDLTPREKLTESIALGRIFGNLGWAAGPAIGGFLTAYMDYAWLFGWSTLITVATLLIIVFCIKETGIRRAENVPLSGILSAGKDRDLLVMTILSVLVCLVIAQISSTLSIFSVQRAGFSSAQYGFLLTLNGLLVAVFQYPSTRFFSRFSDTVSLSLGAFLFGLGYLLMAWVGSYSLATGAIIVLTVGEVIYSPVSSAVIGKMAGPDWRGRYMAFYGLSETLGMALGLYLGGFLLDVFARQPFGIWGVIASSAFAASIGYFIYRIEKRNKHI
jgi:MFS family permease